MGNENASHHEFVDGLIRSLSAQLVADGLINPEGLSKREYQIAALTELKQLIQDGTEFNFIVDHKDSVLQQARAFAQESATDFALMFYATWIEHWLNGMYAWQAKRSGTSGEDLLRKLRFGSMNKKMTSDWIATFGEELDTSWVNIMLEIADHRNSFVHYKWPVQDDSDFSNLKDTRSELLRKAEWVVDKLRAKEHTMVYGGFPHITG